MLRLLALPVAVAAVLAASGCAAAGQGGGTASAGPDASAEPGASSRGASEPGATPPGDAEPGGAEPGGGEPGGEPSAAAPGASGRDAAPDASEVAPSDAPQTLSSTAAEGGDPGSPGLPDQGGASIDDVLRLGAVASWIDRPRLIALSLPASGSCWAFAAQPVVESPTRIVVRVERPSRCDRLDAARTYAIAVPEGIDPSAELQLAVVGLEYEFTLTLPAG